MRGEIYRKLGIKTLINARGFVTAFGGCLMSKETLRAMDEAATAFVLMTDLRAKVGEVIAKATGAEAGCVSTGCSGGIVLATSACIAGTDRVKIERLPDTTGMKNEVIVQANHYIRYINMCRMAGAKMVPYGYINGPGWGWTSPEHLRGTITEETAAIFHVAAWHGHHRGALPLEEVLKVSKEMGIPVFVDAADEWDLRKNIVKGADLVVYSGGKWVLGPQSTGIIAGRKDLIDACEAQDSLGRPLKVQKEEMVGLITALEAYMKRDWDAYWQASEARHERVRSELSNIPCIKLAEIIHKDERGCRICMLKLQLDEEALGMTAFEVNEKLINRDPSVRVREYYASLGRLDIWLDFMPEEHDEILIQALKDVLTSG